MRLITLLCLLAAAPAHAAAQRVEALDVLDRALLPMHAPNAGSTGVAQRARLIGGDGRFVLIETQATDLAAGVEDLNGDSDVWLLDTAENTQRLVSFRSGRRDATANGASRAVALSRDGRRALFSSTATDLVAGQTDANGVPDLFLYDRIDDSVILVSRRVPGASETPDGVSADGLLDASGTRVVFRTTATNLIANSPIVDSNNADDTYLFDLSGPQPSLRLLSHVAGSNVQAGNARSIPAAISLDGRFIAMISGADAMVAGQLAGGGEQLFLEDRLAGTRRLVSHAAANALQESNGLVGGANFSDDARLLAFGSTATNLAAGISDANAGCDIYVHDLAADSNALVTSNAASATTTGNQGGNCSALLDGDGSRIAFTSNASNLVAGVTDVNGSGGDVFVQELKTGLRRLVSAQNDSDEKTADDTSLLTDFDSAGEIVLFESEAANLALGQSDDAGSNDVFLRRLEGSGTRLVSRRHDDAGAAIGAFGMRGALAADGSALLLQGPDDLDADDDNGNLDVYLERDEKLQRLTRGDPALDDRPTDNGFATVPTQGIDAHGRYVVFSSSGSRLRTGLTGATSPQLWLRDRADDALELVTHAAGDATVRANGTHGPIALSADGQWLAYLSTSTELVTGTPGSAQVYLWHRGTRETRLVSHAAGLPATAGNAASTGTPRISADGRFVAFVSNATDLVAGQTGNGAANLFLHDRDTGTTTLVTHAAGSATQAAGGQFGAFALTSDGAFLAFASVAADIADGVPDPNGTADVFLHERATGLNTPVSRSRSSTRMALGGSFDPDLSAGGAHVVFRSMSNELQPGAPTLGTTLDVYLWSRADDSIRLVSHHPSNAAQPSDGNAGAPQIDDAGTRVVFTSTATDLVAGFSSPHGQASLFLAELADDAIFLLDHAAGSATTAAAFEPQLPVLARDGSAVAFVSRATDLVADQIDPGGALDVFRVDLDTRETFLASHRLAQPNVAALPNSSAAAVAPSVSGNGLLVGFATRGDDLVEHDVGGSNAFVYVHDEPVRARIVAADPEPARVGEAVAVRVEFDVARGPATGRVEIDDGESACAFDLLATDDNRGQCSLRPATAGDRTLTARFSSDDGFAAAQATRALLVLPPRRADLAIALSAPDAVATGAGFALQAQVSNAGPDAAEALVVEFSGLPDVASFAGAGWNCIDATCTRDALDAGEVDTLSLQLVAPDEDATLALQATIASVIVDPDDGDNAATATVAVDGAPQIVSISPRNGSTEGGYPLQIAGANFGAASGSVNLGGLPCAVSLWSATQIVCSVPAGAGVREVQVVQAASVLDRAGFADFAYDAPDVDDIAPGVGAPEGGYPLLLTGRDFGAQGASVTIAGRPCTGVQHDAAQPHRRLTCTVPAGSGANLPVVVTQSGQSSDGGARFAYAAVVADLLIDKASGRTEVLARGSDEWTLLVSNLGPDRADGARIVDDLPAHLEAVSWTCTGLAGGSCAAAQGVGDIDVAADLPAGGSALLQVTARVPRAPLIDVVNRARVEAPAGLADPAPANNEDSETDPMATIYLDDFE